MKNRVFLLRAIFITSVVVSFSVSAQSMLILGGGSFAKDCYRASSSASLTGFAGQDDLELCDRAISHGSLKKKDLVATYVNRGVIKVAIEDFQGAVRDYNKAINLNDDTAEAYMNRGNLWFMTNHFEEAIQDYDHSLQLNLSMSHVALFNKGMALENMGHLSQAKENYLAALAQVEDWPMAQSKLDRVNKKLELAQ